MERLTERSIGCFGYDLINANHSEQEFGNYDAFYNYSMAVKKLGEYEDAEEQGLLVKVIRCKDCKYFSGGGLWSKGHWCGRTARPGDCVHVTENDFCSMAEQALAKMKGV